MKNKQNIALTSVPASKLLTLTAVGSRHHGFFACACVLAVLVGAVGCISTPKQDRPDTKKLLPESYPCYRINEPINMDGRMGDPRWTNAPALKFYVPPECKEPVFKTEARLLYDRNYLYVGYKAQDPDVWGYYTNRDDPTCVDDCLELFFQTDPSKEPYYGFEINALGTVNDSFYLRALMAGGGHRRWNKWNCNGLKVKVGINGTLNNPADTDQYWILEMAIPFAELPTLAGKNPQPGNIWQFHAARCEYSVCNTHRGEFSSCAPLPERWFHLNQNWLKLNFK